jgi:hypothetical protein
MITTSAWYVISQVKHPQSEKVNIRVVSRPFKEKYMAEEWLAYVRLEGSKKREYFLAKIET